MATEDMRMTKVECKRCGGEGMASHRHIAGGVCFACGRLPGEGAAELEKAGLA